MSNTQTASVSSQIPGKYGERLSVTSTITPLPAAVMSNPNLSEVEPLIRVNPKQYHRILVRRYVRELLKEKKRKSVISQDKNKTYIHESRHNHATKRPRKNGRFLSQKEINAVEENNAKETLSNGDIEGSNKTN